MSYQTSIFASVKFVDSVRCSSSQIFHSMFNIFQGHFFVSKITAVFTKNMEIKPFRKTLQIH